jgi:hypothetical protein
MRDNRPGRQARRNLAHPNRLQESGNPRVTAPDGVEPVAEFLDSEFPLEPRKKNPSARELEATATKRMTVDLQIDRDPIWHPRPLKNSG